MRRDEPLPADQRADAQRPALSLAGRLELLLVLLVVAGAVYLGPALKALVLAWALAVHTSALGSCRLPGELEQLHVVIANRGGHYAIADCMYLGSKGTYARPQPKP